MYRAKERGRARYELFDEAMRGRAIDRLRVEHDLRRALEREELRLDYQPVVSLRDHTIDRRRGARALGSSRARTDRAERVHPGGRGGRADRADRTLGARARVPPDAVKWHHARPDSAPLGISVNLSAAQFAKRGASPSSSAGCSRATGLDPASLSLEITESGCS